MAFVLQTRHRLEGNNLIFNSARSFVAKLTFVTMVINACLVSIVEGKEGPASTGTGFAVSHQGHILTNYHVVEKCSSIRVSNDGEDIAVGVIATDVKNDLALVKLPRTLSSVARFREGRSLRSGDSIVAMGFPLHTLLASEAHVTTGTVSALAGLGNDTRFFQITAPVQPGNSGGPLLDKSGHVAGVVESKLNALAMAVLTGDIPQNINFALKDVVVTTFLDSYAIPYEKAASTKNLQVVEIAETAKQFTFLLGCYVQKREDKSHLTLETERRAIDAERRALRAEKRAFQKERQAQEDRQALASTATGKHDAPTPSSSLTEDLAKELDVELRKIQKLDISREVRPIEVEPSRPSTIVKGVHSHGVTTLKLSGKPPFGYVALIQHRIVNSWNAPPLDLNSQDYVTVVQFRLHRNGVVTGVAIEESSGNEHYDLAGKRAVLSANPLPVFPPDISDAYFDAHFTFCASSTDKSESCP